VIKKDYKYRFKTLEEFRKDYGHGWRNLDGRTSFIPEMDNLLGTDIDGSWYKNYNFISGKEIRDNTNDVC